MLKLFHSLQAVWRLVEAWMPWAMEYFSLDVAAGSAVLAMKLYKEIC